MAAVIPAPTSLSGRLLDRFTRWFCSRGGVWQTTVATLAVVAVEVSDRGLDPHAFVLMAVLTVYSAITQPALAYSGAVASEQNAALLAQLERVEEQNAELLGQLCALLDHHGLTPTPDERTTS